ncbi:tyrosine-protein kinase STYK1b [Chanos chanos]|uniref:Tyrosine-protein kinase STYK1b n=1 Tax=Chanos chanos TaxID=29144 RepID=A0A6J2W663_CHACN|nr:tyrosine-protein kinase STYK1-like [Chanos chanos]
MSSAAYSLCEAGDTICEIRVYEQEVIIVPVLLLMAFIVTLIFLLLLRFCPERVERLRAKTSLSSSRTPRTKRILQGIDAPLGINPLEHESIALEVPTYSTFPPGVPGSPPYDAKQDSFGKNNTAFNGSFGAGRDYVNGASASFPSPRELPRQRLPEKFNRVSALPMSYSLKSDNSVSLYRARMDNRNVVLRVLNDSASTAEREDFLGFASFLSRVGPHPFLPELLGVVSLRAPLITVIEELENRDLLGFLWRCRQDNVATDLLCEMTEKRIFTMASHVASALEYLHSKNLLHGNVKARSVLVSRMYTAKLWGFGTAYACQNQGAIRNDDPGKKKWQAPEILARRPASQKSDVWSFGLLLYEMVTLGDPPYADIQVTDLLQYHQRGKMLKKPNNCSNSLYSIIKACCQWKEQDRATLAEVSRKLQSGEKSANDKVVIRVPEPVNVEHYLQEAGYGESNNYTIF